MAGEINPLKSALAGNKGKKAQDEARKKYKAEMERRAKILKEAHKDDPDFSGIF